jgi:CcmD family protein
LFFAFGVIWVLLFLYMFSLARRGRELQREIDEIKAERAGETDDE